jgi:hypothetical protein
MFNNLIKKTIIKMIPFQQVRGFKREIVSTDFKIKHNENKFKKQQNDPIPHLLKNMKNTQQKKLKKIYDVESKRRCSQDKFNDRED